LIYEHHFRSKLSLCTKLHNNPKKFTHIEEKFEKIPKEAELSNIVERLTRMERKAAVKEVKEEVAYAETNAGQMKRMLRALEKREREDRRRNLIIKGWKKTDTRELTKEVEQFFKEKIKTEAEVESAKITGSKNFILVRMKTEEEKGRVMRNKKLLGKEEIYIEHDRTNTERDIQRKVVEIAKEEKAKKKEVIIKHWRIRIEGVWYKWNEREEKLMKQTFREKTE